MRKYPPYVRVLTLALIVMGCLCPSLAMAQDQPASFVKPFSEIGPYKPAPESGKTRFAYRASRTFLYGATVFDMSTTVRAMNHPTVASRADGSVIARYHGMETGWASCFGKQNTFAAVTANVGLNVGIDMLSRRIYRQGGRWRMLAIGLNVFKGTGNLLGGIHNVRMHSDINRRIQMTTGYSGPISWSR